jgi:hypothetical protein
MGGACDYAELALERMVAERPLPPVHQHRPGYASSTRSDPALVAPGRREYGFIALLALEELGDESRDLGGPLQWE